MVRKKAVPFVQARYIPGLLVLYLFCNLRFTREQGRFESHLFSALCNFSSEVFSTEVPRFIFLAGTKRFASIKGHFTFFSA